MTDAQNRRDQWFYFGPWMFSIDAALALIAERPRATRTLAVVQWAKAYGLTTIDDPHPRVVSLIGPEPGSVNREHAMSTDLTQPVIIARLDVNGQSSALLIDGIHRLYHAWKAEQPELPAYLLTIAETRQITHDRIIGGITPKRRTTPLPVH